MSCIAEFRLRLLVGKPLFPVLAVLLCVALTTPVLAFEVTTIGDSITQGFARSGEGQEFGITSPVNGAANIGGYQPFLKATLDENLEESNVYNWGVAGERSVSAVSRIGGVLDSRPSDYILIMYGANDAYAGTLPSDTKAAITSMVAQSQIRGVRPIIAEITPNNSGSLIATNTVISQQYNPVIRQVAVERNIDIALMYTVMKAQWGTVPYHSGDGLHLSFAGNFRMHELWFAPIFAREFVPEPPPPPPPPPPPVIIPSVAPLLLDD